MIINGRFIQKTKVAELEDLATENEISIPYILRTKKGLWKMLTINQRTIRNEVVPILQQECRAKRLHDEGSYQQLKSRLDFQYKWPDFDTLFNDHNRRSGEDQHKRDFKINLKIQWNKHTQKWYWTEMSNDIDFPKSSLVKDLITLPGFEAIVDTTSIDETSSGNEIISGDRTRFANKLQDFIWYDVIRDGASLLRAVALGLWGPYEQRQWRRVKRDVSRMWNAAMTEGTEMYRLRHQNYRELARVVQDLRASRIINQELEEEDVEPELVDQVTRDDAWCTIHYIQLIADCYDIAIFVWDSYEPAVINNKRPVAYRGQIPDRGNPKRKQIHIIYNEDLDHWQPLIAYPPVATHFEEMERIPSRERTHLDDLIPINILQDASRAAPIFEWNQFNTKWQYWNHLESLREPIHRTIPKWPKHPVLSIQEELTSDNNIQLT
jgi:hypothetical protein